MNPKYLIIHSTEVSYNLNPDQAKATNNYHKSLWNFRSRLGYYAGYNIEISKAGKETIFREDGEATAAAIGRNNDSIHIALDGNFDQEMPTDEQVATLTKILREKMQKWKIPAENIRLHRYFATISIRDGKFVRNTSPYLTWDGCLPYKTCPGGLLPDNWGQLLVAAPPSVVATEDVNQAISILERLLELFKNYLRQRGALGMPENERFEAA